MLSSHGDVVYYRLKCKQRKLDKKASKEGASKEEGGAKGEVDGTKKEKEEEEEAEVSSGGEDEPHFVIGGR